MDGWVRSGMNLSWRMRRCYKQPNTGLHVSCEHCDGESDTCLDASLGCIGRDIVIIAARCRLGRPIFLVRTIEEGHPDSSPPLLLYF